MHYDLLVHVDLADAARMSMALTNIINYKKALTEHEYTVIMVANGGAVPFYLPKSESHAVRIKELSEAGVVFKACKNALEKHKITAEDIPDFIEIVPAGIVEIVDLQRAGFAYLKP